MATLHTLPRNSTQYTHIIHTLGKKIREGKLVAFPTETVYGLGANTLDKTAVLDIFSTKKRPLSDPVISHVACTQDALDMVLDLSPEEELIFRHLTHTFWPGPLSIVGKAKSNIPLETTAFTGLASVRCPDNIIALDLIREAGVPISAPSANKFGHISPSTAAHVYEEFSDSPIDIIDGGDCQVGLESTVIRLEITHTCTPESLNSRLYKETSSTFERTPTHNINIYILRTGKINKEDLEDSMLEFTNNNTNWHLGGVFHQSTHSNHSFAHNKSSNTITEHTYNNKKTRSQDLAHSTRNNSEDIRSSTHSKQFETFDKTDKPYNQTDDILIPENGYPDEFQPQPSPGMLLTHYAPNCPTFLILPFQDFYASPDTENKPTFGDNSTRTQDFTSTHTGGNIIETYDKVCDNIGKLIFMGQEVKLDSKDCVLIDIGKKFNSYKTLFLDYYELCESYDKTGFEIAAKSLFKILHIAESRSLEASAKAILITHFDPSKYTGLALALYDRIYRSASGKFLQSHLYPIQ